MANAEGAVCGYVIYEIEHRPASPVRHADTHGILHHISVDAACRRHGVGRVFIEAMRARLAKAGISIVATTYANFNDASARLMADAGLSPKIVHAAWRARS